MRFFLAGIMQGSHLAAVLHQQEYREQIKCLLFEAFPGADIYDPLSDHADSLAYNDELGRRVFTHHNRVCRNVDVVLAFVPEASMGTAIEMWEAHEHGRTVITISPLKHNWTVKFLSHALYADIDEFAAAIADGQVAQLIEDRMIDRAKPFRLDEQRPPRVS